MELVQLSCNGCGADIDVSDDTRFTTCRYCHAKLEVRRTDGAAFTRVRAAVKRIERKTDAVADEVSELRAENRVLALQRDLDEVEREWEERSKELMNRSKDGTLSIPRRGGAIAIAALSAVFALVVVGVTMKAESGFGPLMGLFVVLMGGLAAVLQHQKAVKFERAYAVYYDRREELAERLAKARRRARRADDSP